MKKYDNLEELKAAHPSIYYHQENIDKQIIKDYNLDSIQSYNGLLGGHVIVIESVDEWNALLSIIPCKDDVYMFDGVAQTDDELFMTVFIASNDAGGPLYYVPRQIYTQRGSICKSV